jgi:hypothetical protein
MPAKVSELRASEEKTFSISQLGGTCQRSPLGAGNWPVPAERRMRQLIFVPFAW